MAANKPGFGNVFVLIGTAVFVPFVATDKNPPKLFCIERCLFKIPKTNEYEINMSKK